LQRDDSHPPTVRIDPIDDDDLDDAGEQVVQAFAARTRLAALGSGAELVGERVTLATALRLQRDIEPSKDTGVAITESRVELAEGTKHVVETTEDALEVIASLDGRRLGEVVDDVAARLGLGSGDATRLQREAVALIRELLELGALELH
ncbi:MAG TPA: hypothetical protein VIU81_06090, partial [Gaiellaceae bacterium]